MDLARVGSDRSSDLAGHDDRTFYMGCVDSEVGDERFGEAFHCEFRRGIGGVRNARSYRCPKTIDAARIDDVAFVRPLQHRQESPCAVIDATPADVERLLPFLTAAGDQATTAADACVVEQQMDLVSVLLRSSLIAEPLDLSVIGDIGDVRRNTQALRQPVGLAEPLR